MQLNIRYVNEFALKILKKHISSIKIDDTSDLINKNILFKNPVVSDAANYHVCKINLYRLLTEELEKNVSHSIFIDMLVGFSEFNLSNERIFRILKRYDIKGSVQKSSDKSNVTSVIGHLLSNFVSH
jgi:hypothetical protein